MQLLDLRLPQPTLLWPALDRLEPHNAQGELYLTDAVRDLVERGERVAAHVAADPAETEGVNTRAELAAAAAALRDRINLAHMLAGVAIVDPGSTWIEPDVELEPDAIDPPVHASSAASTTRRRRAPRSARTSVAIDAEIGPGAIGRALLLPSPGHGPRAAREGRHVRGDQEVDGSARARRCRTSRTSATPRSARGRTSAQARSPRTSRTSPVSPKGKTTIGRNVRVAVDTMFVAPVTVGDDAWTAAGTVVTDDVPDNALVGLRAPAGRQGRARWKAGRLSRRCPGLEGAGRDGHRSSSVGRAVSLTPPKRLAVVAGSSHPELAEKIAGHLGVELDAGRA